MFDLLIAILFGINNSQRAKRKGQNTAVWIFITAVSVIVGEVIGMFLVLLFFNNGVVNINAFSTGHESADQLAQQTIKLLNDDPVHTIFIFLCGFGGYLLIRYILDRMPDKKDEQKNWLNDINDFN